MNGAHKARCLVHPEMIERSKGLKGQLMGEREVSVASWVSRCVICEQIKVEQGSQQV